MRIAHAQFPHYSISRTQQRPIVVLVALASGTRFTTVSSDGEDVEDSGKDDSENSSRTSAEPESILSWLKAVDRSGLCRHKRSIVVNQSRKIILLRSIMAYFWSIMAYL